MPPEKRSVGGVERATRSELRKLGCSVQSEAMPASAVRLAVLIDAARGAESGAAAVSVLRQVMSDLVKSAARPEKDAIDDINAEPAVLRAVPG